MELYWEELELGDGGDGLVALAGDVVHGIAPPGIRFRRDEESEQRVCWRYARWDCEGDELPVIAIAQPLEVIALDTKEVVELLPADRHDFVRQAMVCQIRRAEMFGQSTDGRCVTDQHAQLAGRTSAWAAAELAAAFPEESWFAAAERSIRIPATVDELLDKLPAGASPHSWRSRLRGDLQEEFTRRLRSLRRWFATLRNQLRGSAEVDSPPPRRRRRASELIPRQSSDLQDADSRLAAIVSRRRGGSRATG